MVQYRLVIKQCWAINSHQNNYLQCKYVNASLIVLCLFLTGSFLLPFFLSCFSLVQCLLQQIAPDTDGRFLPNSFSGHQLLLA